LKRCRLLCICSLYIKGLATCVGSPFESAGKENIGQCRVKNPLYLIVKSGKGNSSKWINPYCEYLQGTILHIFVVAYPFLDSLFPDLAAGAEALCSLNVVHHNLGQVNPSDSTVPSHASNPPAAYVNTARTNGTIEQKFQVLKSSYAGVLPGKKPVRMDTFVLYFYTWYKRHMNAVLEHWVRFSKKSNLPAQQRRNTTALQNRSKKSGLVAAMEPIISEIGTRQVCEVLLVGRIFVLHVLCATIKGMHACMHA
jgi:hypothetical protein